jgi:AraC family transcriptional regulator
MRLQPTTLGHVVEVREIGDFRLTETTHAPSLRLPRHAHARPAATLVLEGSFAEEFSDASFACSPASVLVKPAGEPHADRYGPGGARCLIVEWQVDWEDGRFSSPAGAALLPAAAAGDLAVRFRRELRARDRASARAVQDLVLDLLGRLGRQGEGGTRLERRPWVAAAQDFLRAHFAEPVRIRDAAREVGVHPVHLARSFRREYGCSPSAYLRDLRLAWARRALTDGSRSLAWIALEAGFADQSHLSRTFKRAYGVSPRRFRQELREASPPDPGAGFARTRRARS